MYAIKLELKLNNAERTLMAKHAGFSRFVYNYGLALYKQVMDIKGGLTKKIAAIRKVLTNFTKKKPEFDWMNQLSSRVYQNAFIALKNGLTRFFKGLGEFPVFKFATFSDGTTVEAPATISQAKIKLAKLQWRNRNKQLGNKKAGIPASNNAKKYYKQVRLLHARISNIRHDFLQKLTTEISRKYSCIRIENLNVSGMMANSKLADAISNLGLYEFRRQLSYKQSMFGTVVELVDRWFPSSKICSDCGHIQPMKLSDRVFHCQECRSVKCRDFNASLNLEGAPPEKVRAACSELNDCGQEAADSPGRSSK
ncbi:RNA-guided endonuclease InsQ/TnpB family protein [Coleofasciculus sp.]|uniref:RNA-guided endonuclease InsQ/TnpB family protein n=1 Tax=Coleofasciculus sp. TaxID=3100458 RepID=UPI003A1B6951